MKLQMIPTGAPFSDKQIEDIAYTIYSRFYQVPGGVDFKSPLFDKSREQIKQTVRQVVDGITLSGMLIVSK